MASTSFGILITGDSRGAVKAIDLTSEELKKLEGVTDKTSRKIKQTSDDTSKGFTGVAASAAKMGAAIGAAGVALSGLLLAKVIKETSDSEAAVAQLNATLKATGGVSGQTSDALQATASAMQRVTTYSDEAVIGAQSLLLAFKNIKGDTFDRTTRSVLDFATAMRVDVSSAAKLVGKALDDPEKGMNRLARAGVTFTDSQKETIKAMVEMGDTAGAQALILEQLESRFQGSAEAARNTLGGALKGLQNTFGELFEVTSETSGGMVDQINLLSETLSNPQIKQSISDIVGGLIEATNWAIKAASALAWFFDTDSKKNLVDLADEIHRVELALKDATSGRTVDMKAAAALRKELEELNKAYNKELKAVQDRTKAQEGVAKATKTETAATKENNTVHLISAETQKKHAKETDALADSKKKLQDRIEAASKSIKASSDELTLMNNKTEEYIKTLKFETEQTTRSAKEQAIENDVRAAGTRITAEQEKRIREASAAKYDAVSATEAMRKAEEEAAAAQEKYWSHLTDSMSDIFTAMVVDGKSSFDTLNDGFSAMIKKMIAEAAFNEIVIGFGGTAANGQNNGNSTIGQRVGNAAATYGISELLTSGFTGFFGSKQQIQGDPLAKGINTLASASFKPIEWLTGKSFSDVFGQKNDGNNAAAADFNLSTGSVTGRTWGKSGGDVSAVVSLVDPILQLAEAIGGSSFSGSVTAGTKGISYGGRDFGQNAEAFYSDAFRDVIESATGLDESLKKVILDFDGANDEFARFTSVMISLDKGAAMNAVTDAIEDFNGASRTLYGQYNDTTSALLRSIEGYDGTIEAAEELSSALITNQDAAYSFAMSIQTIGKAISDMVAEQANDIRESVLTVEDLRAKRTSERDALAATLSELTDPADVEAAAQKILTLNRQIFDSLAEDERFARSEEFAGFAENVDDVTQSVLSRALSGVTSAQETINTQIAAMLKLSGDTQVTAANTQLNAAQTFANYVNLLQTYGIPVTVTTVTPEVNV